MTFLCVQPSFDGSNLIHMLVVKADMDPATRMYIAIEKNNSKENADLLVETEDKSDAEVLAIDLILHGCELVEPNCVAASSRIALKTRRGRGNIVLANNADTTHYRKYGNFKMIIYRDDIPEGKGIVLYKGQGEIDSGFFFSQGPEKSFLRLNPRWRDYAMIFETTTNIDKGRPF